ncbi:uncharacterized protein LOC129612539 [Condylostylus longicornis]|uniref:uncharacterized protein LOC129612539 n=1 Tax=Condylostylus longicornis TaxID=2530218 RepID=UPI00244E1A96|nr:uncharacterized protein LOC129612539 [Condylostylus longicornis]
MQINSVFSLCNVCGPGTQIACINQTAFRRCSGSAIIPGSIAVCPSGTFCNSDEPMRCVKTEPSCGGLCGVCNLNTYVACLSKTKYAYCFGETVSDQTGECSEEEYCNSGYPGICINSAGPIVAEPSCPVTSVPPTTIEPSTSTESSTVTEPSTSSSSTLSTSISTEPSTSSSTTSSTSISTESSTSSSTTSTTSISTESSTSTSTTTLRPPYPITDAQLYCITIGKPGKFPKINDVTCKKYYYCYNLGFNINGQEYTCVGASYYNCQTQMCSSTCDTSCSVLQIITNYNHTKINTVP